MNQPIPRYHQIALSLWLLAALTPSLLTKNPFYLLLIIIAVSLNYFNMGRKSPTAQGWAGFLRLGMTLVAFNIIFNLLSVRAGATTLFTLPAWRWQTATEMGAMTVVQIGGKVSLESLIYGLSNGLSLLAILLTFATFNILIDHYRLLRTIPRFLYQSAMVMSIAITFIPQMMLAQQEIREAQAIRGHRFRRIRDLLPLFVILLAEGLERSITLAEAMESRGFGLPPHHPVQKNSYLLKSFIAMSLLILSGGVFAWSYFPHSFSGHVTMLIGALMLVITLWRVGHNVKRSRYHRTLWHRRDTLVTVASLITFVIYLTTWLTNRMALIFYPYPRLTWPPFSLFLAIALLLLLSPVLADGLTEEMVEDGSLE